MDPVATAFSVIKGIMQAIDMAQKYGLMGGSTGWVTYAQDLAAVTGNFATFAADAASNPGVYDNLTEEEIRQKLTPEGWSEKEERIKRELGTG